MRDEKKDKIDWSSKRFKQRLIETRKYLWHDDTIDRMATWIGFKPGMSVVDVGCGLAYLGYTYWQFFKKGGRYIGIDNDAKLLSGAKKAAQFWTGRKPLFVTGDAYRLPLRDSSVDCAMCQTLLIWLKEPKRALAEMARVVKPGGLVVCFEPDNLSERSHTSLPELCIRDRLRLEKYHLIWNRGRIKLGQGDYTIGNKVPHLMKEVGLADIAARLNDMVFILEPPYKSPVQKYLLSMVNRDLRSQRKERKFWLDLERRQYLAGGGNMRDFNRLKKFADKRRDISKKQIKRRVYFYCYSGIFYVVKGEKPKKELMSVMMRSLLMNKGAIYEPRRVIKKKQMGSVAVDCCICRNPVPGDRLFS
jgi:ubiquinone/menaquinone biosynthesis C-methylase UbiE